MTYNLFIDDERFPSQEGWIVVRSSCEAIDYIRKNGIPNFIRFDHDLGYDSVTMEFDTTMKFLQLLTNHMIEHDLKFPSGFRYDVHSMNPVGARNIVGYMKNFVPEFS